VYHQNEVEQSTYNFEHANVDLLFTLFNSYEAEAKKMTTRSRCPYELLKAVTRSTCSTRAARSVTERAALHRPHRALSRLVAQAYYDSREKLGFGCSQSAGRAGLPPTPRTPRSRHGRRR
jgi:glycyl-tRNA synthetase alpha chain